MTPTSEEWRPVLGYEGLYEVSDQGRVRGVDRLTYAGPGRFRRQPGRALKPCPEPDGRRYVRLCRDAQHRHRRIAALVLTAFIGPRPAGMYALHNDGDCTNDRLGNLRWDTPKSNSADAILHGAHPNARKTHCKRKHVLAPPNLLTSQPGSRVCRACKTARTTLYYARKRGVELDYEALVDHRYRQIMEAA